MEIPGYIPPEERETQEENNNNSNSNNNNNNNNNSNSNNINNNNTSSSSNFVRNSSKTSSGKAATFGEDGLDEITANSSFFKKLQEDSFAANRRERDRRRNLNNQNRSLNKVLGPTAAASDSNNTSTQSSYNAQSSVTPTNSLPSTNSFNTNSNNLLTMNASKLESSVPSNHSAAPTFGMSNVTTGKPDESEKYKKMYQKEMEEKNKLKTELDSLKMRLAQTVANLSNNNSSAGSVATNSVNSRDGNVNAVSPIMGNRGYIGPG